MQVTTYRYGNEEVVEVDDAQVFEFRPGLTGFEQYQRYARLQDGDSPIEWLQSLDHAGVCFTMMEPFLFYPNYGFELSDFDCHDLGLKEPQDALVRCLLTLHDAAEETTANLMAPIVLSRSGGRGRQIVLQESHLPLRFFVFEAMRVPMAA
jgi:flagellar assembly factor FliW